MPIRNDFTGIKWLAVVGRPNSLFLMLLALHLVPIWTITFFPTQDGPVHVHTASVLRHYFDSDLSTFREYYTIHRDFNPNWIGHVLMWGLMYIFSPFVAEKLLLSLYVIVLPISIYYVLLAINRKSIFLALLTFPFIYNYPLHMGFYNFCLSLPLFFFVLGYWLRHQNELNVSKILILSLLSLALYFSHIVSLACAYIVLLTMVLWRALVQGAGAVGPLQKKVRTFCSDAKQGLLSVIVVFLPATVLVVEYFLRNWSGTSSEVPSLSEIVWRLMKLGWGEGLVSFSRQEVWASVAVHLIFFGLTIYILFRRFTDRHVYGWDGLLIATVLILVLYLVFPSEMAGGGFIEPRLALFVVLLLLLWLGTEIYSDRLRQGIQAATIAVALGFLGLHTINYWQWDPYFDEYATIQEKVEPNKTVLPLTFSPYGHSPDKQRLSLRVAPLLHAEGYVAAMADLVDLGNYSAATNYFPIRFQTERDPYEIMPGFEKISVDDSIKVDLLSYEKQSGGSVDYVVLAGLTDGHRMQERTKAILAQLAKRYELIYVSSPREFFQLYRRKSLREWAPHESCGNNVTMRSARAIVC